jgi:hypothetical protein
MPNVAPGSVPRLARLMALAIHIEGLLQRGDLCDYATVARLGQVSRARVSQIMALLHLAPDIQEEILFLPRTVAGRDPITERHVRSIAAVSLWPRQRRLWRRRVRRAAENGLDNGGETCYALDVNDGETASSPPSGRDESEDPEHR